MAIYAHGINYSFDSDDLIARLKNDIKQHGSDFRCYSIFELVDSDVKKYVDYNRKPVEVAKGQHTDIFKASTLLDKLEEQNSIL